MSAFVIHDTRRCATTTTVQSGNFPRRLRRTVSQETAEKFLSVVPPGSRIPAFRSDLIRSEQELAVKVELDTRRRLWLMEREHMNLWRSREHQIAALSSLIVEASRFQRRKNKRALSAPSHRSIIAKHTCTVNVADAKIQQMLLSDVKLLLTRPNRHAPTQQDKFEMVKKQIHCLDMWH